MNIKVDNIKYIYDKLIVGYEAAIDGVSFEIKENEFISIVGETGSGKSTLVQHLNGLLKANSGSIFVDGKTTADCHIVSRHSSRYIVPARERISFLRGSCLWCKNCTIDYS